MPAITVDDTLVLPRVPRPDPTPSHPRPVAKLGGDKTGDWNDW